jgi:hypothetical protein
VQSLYEGSRGPGAARLLGVTVYVNGLAGLGPDITSAARQALNEPPRLRVRRLREPGRVGAPVPIAFDVENARREIVTITSGNHRSRKRLRVVNGRGTLDWTPVSAGRATVRVDVEGLDGTRVSDRMSFQVLSSPPAIRLLHTPGHGVVGRPLRIPFQVAHGRRASATVSMRSGIVLRRSFLLHRHTGVLEWTPKEPGLAVVRLQARGRQGQSAATSLRLRIDRSPPSAVPPSVGLVRAPRDPTVGVPATFAFRAAGCRVATARIRVPAGDASTWRFPCPVRKGTVTWTPASPGSHLLIVVARGSHGLTASLQLRVDVAADQSKHPSASPSASPTGSAHPTPGGD